MFDVGVFAYLDVRCSSFSVRPGQKQLSAYDPQVLTLEGAYAEKYLSHYPVQKGELKIPDPQMARYHPYAAGSDPIPLKTILMPAYDPSETPGIEELAPGEIFTELLGYCFPPQLG